VLPRKHLAFCRRLQLHHIGGLTFVGFAQHGALPWRGSHQRRTLLYRFNAGHASYTDSGSDHMAELDAEWTRYMTPEQRLVVSRPGYLGRRQELAAERLMEARARQSREREAGLARL